MKIVINGKTAILRKGTSFKFVSEKLLRNATEYFSFHYRRYFKPPPLCFLQENIGRVA